MLNTLMIKNPVCVCVCVCEMHKNINKVTISFRMIYKLMNFPTLFILVLEQEKLPKFNFESFSWEWTFQLYRAT